MRALPLVLGIALALPFALRPEEARASVSIAIFYDQLVERADAVAVVTPLEQSAAWEGRKMYTYTRVRVESAVAGDVTVGGEVWIRTLGGVIGKIAQQVEGEPSFDIGSSSLVFMHHVQAGLYGVVARAQGQFFFDEDAKTRVKKLRRHDRPGLIVAPPSAPNAGSIEAKKTTGAVKTQAVTPSASAPPLATQVIEGKNLDDLAKDVKTAFARAHSPTHAH